MNDWISWINTLSRPQSSSRNARGGSRGWWVGRRSLSRRLGKSQNNSYLRARDDMQKSPKLVPSPMRSVRRSRIWYFRREWRALDCPFSQHCIYRRAWIKRQRSQHTTRQRWIYMYAPKKGKKFQEPGCVYIVLSQACIPGALWAKRGERGILHKTQKESEVRARFAFRSKCRVCPARLIKRLLCRLFYHLH